METLLFYIQTYGYFFVFIATFFEGETVVALAGFTAFEGYLHLPAVILAAFLGGMLGDQVYFYFGRYRGNKFLESHPKLLARAKGIQRLLERHQNLLIFGSRFMYGFRIVIPIAFGTSKVSSVRFFIFNFLGAAVWSVFFSCAGYLLGTTLEIYLGHFHQAEKSIVVGVLVGVIIVQLISLLSKRIERRVEEAEKREERKSLDNPSELIR